MNNKRRKELNKALNYLNLAYSLVSTSLDDEEDYMNNIPENLQSSDRYERANTAVDLLYGASETLEDVIDNVQSAINV